MARKETIINRHWNKAHPQMGMPFGINLTDLSLCEMAYGAEPLISQGIRKDSKSLYDIDLDRIPKLHEPLNNRTKLYLVGTVDFSMTIDAARFPRINNQLFMDGTAYDYYTNG